MAMRNEVLNFILHFFIKHCASCFKLLTIYMPKASKQIFFLIIKKKAQLHIYRDELSITGLCLRTSSSRECRKWFKINFPVMGFS